MAATRSLAAVAWTCARAAVRARTRGAALLLGLAPVAPTAAAAQAAAPAAGVAPIPAATSEELAPAVFAARRARLVAALGPDAVAILAAPPERIRNGDNAYPYRTGSDFWYLTGFGEEGALALIETRDGKPF